MRNALALFLGFAFTGFAGAEVVNFDQGIDTKGLVSHYDNNDGFNDYHNYNDNFQNIPNVQSSIGHTRYTRDCARFSFNASDGDKDILSERVRLRSTEYVEQCYQVPSTDANGHVTYHQNCYERPGQTWNQSVQISIKARKLLSWERENFEVCLEGPWSPDFYIDDAAYKYNVRRVGNYDTLFELTPEHKIAMNPDLNGIQFVDFKYNKADETYTLKVKDIWSKDYAGDKIMIKVDFYKDGWWFFNSYKGKKEVTFVTADTYEITFTESALEKSVDKGMEADFKGTEITKGAKKYYAKWGFTRISSLSTDKFMKKGETPKITK